MDWIIQVGILYVMYGCGKCLGYPCRSNGWLRCTRGGKEEDEWGDSSAGVDVGHWRCPRGGCFEKWTWTCGGNRRLVVMGQADVTTGFRPGYLYRFCGALSPKVENLLQFLKGATALQYLGDKPITKENLLQVIQTANTEVERKFSKGVREVVALTSRVPPQADLDYYNCRVVCEDTRLSLNASGVKYLAVDLQGTKVETMEDGEMEDLLMTMSAGLAVEAVVPDGPSQRKLQWEIVQSGAFKHTRQLMAQICG